MMEFDPTRMSQVIDNLLSNAIKYSPENTKVTIALEKEKDIIRFSITDEGPGIKPEDTSELFKAFKRLGHKTTGGESSHGLGLSICLKIINAHSGIINYKHTANTGSHFYFELPR